MLDETNPATEVEETNLPQESEVESDQPEEERQELEEGENPESEQEELEEADFEGKKYKLPKELKGALLRQSDYTKKTQEIAETKRQIEAREQAFRQQVEVQQKEFKTYATVHNLESKIAEYDKFFESPEWNEVVESDTPRAVRAQQEYQALHAQRGKHVQEISRIEQERSQTQQQHFAKLEEETRSVLEREIKGWSPQTAKNLADFAKSQGLAEGNMAHALKYDAVAVKLLHKAHLYDQLVKKQLAKPKIEIKPVGKIQSGPSAVNKDPAKMSDAEYSKWRQQRRAKNL